MPPRMRNIDGIFKAIHELDSSSCISKNFIRQILITGKVKIVMVGNRRLANLDSVLNYLENPSEEIENTKEYGTIRKIESR